MKAIVLNEKDCVAVAVENLKKGSRIKIGNKKIKLREDIPMGHKFAVRRIEKNEKIVKDGEVIGIATRLINEGEHVSVHNIKSLYVERG